VPALDVAGALDQVLAADTQGQLSVRQVVQIGIDVVELQASIAAANSALLPMAPPLLVILSKRLDQAPNRVLQRRYPRRGSDPRLA
jgi:hypothetical protein